jgi:hypothetical protein
MKSKIDILVISTIAILSASACMAGVNYQAFAQATQDQGTPFVVQNTSRSGPDPLPGHQSHQIVIAAPPRDDGKIYSGIATFTSSQPVEVVVLHTYKPVSDQNPQGGNQTAGEPLNAPFKDGKVAISLMKKFTDSPVNAGSLAFAGNALAFHNLEGKPFVVTYTIDGKISSLTQQ